jgi:catechol 2,3-dioxygenase-like lactoylglutathione lyase family enzyme
MLGAINIVAFVPTKDSGKARSFYQGVLGLRFVKDDGFALEIRLLGTRQVGDLDGSQWRQGGLVQRS